MYFNLLKDIFSDIYRDKKPLSSDLVCENAVRALSSQHLLYLGDLCKFKSKYEILPNQRDQADSQGAAKQTLSD